MEQHPSSVDEPQVVAYEAPKITDHGTLVELTAAGSFRGRRDRRFRRRRPGSR